MSAYITKLNQEKYKKFTETGLVLVDIWATWCNPCRTLLPIIEEVSTDYHGKLSVGKLDADENMELAKELNVRSLPTILIYKDGEVVDRSTGLITKQAIIGMVSKHMDESIEF